MLISLVVPVYNEQEAVPLFHAAVQRLAREVSFEIEVVFVNDGSQDATEQQINRLITQHSGITVVNLSRNFGKEPALLAGLDYVRGDAVIPMDVDLQDPLELIPNMVQHWQEGADTVLAKRDDRASDSVLKRVTARLFYRFHNALSQYRIEENVGDFRLLSRQTVAHIKALPERTLFMKGMMSWVGGHVAVVEYSRPARAVGRTKFSGWRLWNLALDGITSGSTVPLRVWTYLGATVAGCALLYGLWLLITTLWWGNPVAGYASLMVSLLFLGGVQLVGIGVMGEYIGRIYTQVQSRPRYIVESVHGEADEKPRQ